MARKIFHGDSQGNTQILRVSGRAIAVDLELTWQYLLSEFRPKQTRAVCVNRFHLSLWASMAAHMIHVATSRVPLITSGVGTVAAVAALAATLFWP